MNALPASQTSLPLIQQATQNGMLHNAAASRDMDKIEQAAQEFEAVFIAEMMKPMFEGISTEAPFGGGKGEEVFRSLLLQEYGKTMAATNSIGIAAHVKEYLLQLQESKREQAENSSFIQPQTRETANHAHSNQPNE